MVPDEKGADHASPASEGTKEAPTPAREEAPFSIYSKSEKFLIILIISIAATFSGFSSNIYFPFLPTIASDLSVTIELINLTVTSYMIFQGITPSLWGAIADVSGRRVTYMSTFVVYIVACIVLANTKNYATLVVVRCLQSTGSAATIAIGSGVIGDITTRAERGGYMGIFQAGCLVPVAIGPVIGGALANSLGWRSVFWFLTIYAGVFLVLLTLLLPETLRSLAGNGSFPIKGTRGFPLTVYQKRYKARDQTAVTQRVEDLPPKKPLNLLSSIQILGDTQILPILTFLSIYYATWQMSITALSTLFKANYGLNDTQIGLTFLANGIGSMIGTLSTGKLLDIDYRKIEKACQAKGQEMPLYRARLRTVWIWSAMQISSLLVFGWTLQERVNIAGPIVSTFFTGWGAMSVQSMVSTYLVDVFPDRSASATAAMNLMRCLVGAGGTAAVIPLVNRIGVGWSFVLLAALMTAALGLVAVQITLAKKLHKAKESQPRTEQNE